MIASHRGAADSDGQIAGEQRASIRAQLAQLADGNAAAWRGCADRRVPPRRFEVEATVADPEVDRRKILVLAAAIIDDDEINFFESSYLRALAAALALPDSALAGLTIEVEPEPEPEPEPEELQRMFATDARARPLRRRDRSLPCNRAGTRLSGRIATGKRPAMA